MGSIVFMWFICIIKQGPYSLSILGFSQTITFKKVIFKHELFPSHTFINLDYVVCLENNVKIKDPSWVRFNVIIGGKNDRIESGGVFNYSKFVNEINFLTKLIYFLEQWAT